MLVCRRRLFAAVVALMPAGYGSSSSGSRFLDSLPVSMREWPAGWSHQPAFVFDDYNPSRIRVSIGGILAVTGAYVVPDDAPDPREVSTASGMVACRLLGAGPREGQVGLTFVQMLSGDRLRAEVFASETLASAEFTGVARVYVR
ncbi:MAG: hypothetical protein IT176_07805 [Acidobacteria bacterium]|nr:hypothetical protein [Acidobacteriota bacterium]